MFSYANKPSLPLFLSFGTFYRYVLAVFFVKIGLVEILFVTLQFEMNF